MKKVTRADFIRREVAHNLDQARYAADIPGLGSGRTGKVRHMYSTTDASGQAVVIMSTSDRVSAFDVVLDRAIPYKGAVLNAISKWWFHRTEDIMANAFIASPSPYIVIQRELIDIGFECIVRRYLWGGLATDYEKGQREKCGVVLNDGLWRYQKFETSIFTPTTKSKKGHDEDVTFEGMAALMAKFLASREIQVDIGELARSVRAASLDLCERGEELAQGAGLSLVDTKYEFGLDPSGKLYLIDEIHTPDSSRYVESAEWKEKWPLIHAQMTAGPWANVSELLQVHPELKVKELSKQIVRDILLEQGYDPVAGGNATLRDEDVVETAARYIELYERLTGEEFDLQANRFGRIDESVLRQYSLHP